MGKKSDNIDYANIVENTTDTIVVTNIEGEIEYANPAFLKTYGLKLKDVMGKKPNIIKSGTHDRDFYEKMWQVILSGKAFRGVCVNSTKNGELLYEEKTITPLKSGKKKITGFVSIGKDISDRIMSDKIIHDRNRRIALLLSEEQHLRRVLERIAKINEVIIYSLNVQDIINKSTLILSQQQQYELVIITLKDRNSGILEISSKHGKALEGLDSNFDEEFFNYKKEFAKETIINNSPIVVERVENRVKIQNWLKRLKLEETRSFISLPLRPKYDEDPYGVITVFTKNSLILKKEAKFLKDISETLGFAISSFYERELLKERETLLVQQSKLASMGEMISSIAHQWRQPLNGISGVVANLYDKYELKKMKDEDFSDSVKEINLLLKHLSQTIDDFRNYFKPDKECEIFDVVEVVKEAIRIFRIQLDDNFIELELIEAKESRFYSRGFLNEFKQVILNLLNNSKDAILERRKMMKNKTSFDSSLFSAKISISFKSDSGYNYISFEDNGKGIDSAKVNRIYEPYFTTKGEGAGTGIGLYMSKMIIENSMDGELFLIKRKNPTIFGIKLPKFSRIRRNE